MWKWKRTGLSAKEPKEKKNKSQFQFSGCNRWTDTLREAQHSPGTEHIRAPNSSSLVSHDEFNEHLVGKVWLGPLSSGSSGITGPRVPQIAEADEATSIIKQRREESVKERENEGTKPRQGEDGENEGERQGTKQMELREGLPVDEGQGRLAKPHPSAYRVEKRWRRKGETQNGETEQGNHIFMTEGNKQRECDVTQRLAATDGKYLLKQTAYLFPLNPLNCSSHKPWSHQGGEAH